MRKRMDWLAGMALLSVAALTACGQVYTDGGVYGGATPYAPVGYGPGPVQYVPVPPAPPVVAAETVPRLAPAQLDQLTAPIALYPDPLLAEVLPAATYPQEIAEAQAWLQTYPNVDEGMIQAQRWEPAVKAVLHYPSVLAMMSQNLPWTQALGAAFVYQQGDVMDSIQRLRLQAFNAGVLVSNAQQQVVWAGNVIEILPANPAVIYVPIYDPQVVYAPLYQPGVVIQQPPQIWYGPAVPIGGWLNADWDWDDHLVVVGGGWHHGWRHDPRRGWERDEREEREWHRGVQAMTLGRPLENRAMDVGRPWRHDPGRPAPVMPAPVVDAARRETFDAHRGWENRPRTPERLPVAVPHATLPPRAGAREGEHAPPATPAAPEVRHAVPTPAPAAAPAPAPAGNVFGGYQNRVEVDRARERARTNRTGPVLPPEPAVHAAIPAAPAPVARPPAAPVVPAPVPPAVHAPAPPAVSHEPARPAPAAAHAGPAVPAFQGMGSAAETRAQSERGHGSMHR